MDPRLAESHADKGPKPLPMDLGIFPAAGGIQALGWEVREAPGGSFVSKDGVSWGQAAGQNP